MDSIAFGMLAAHSLFWIACLVIVIVLVYRRMEAKKHENLDEYDN